MVMGVTKRVVCLANSRKPYGRCVAGVEVISDEPAGWIRPVSDREGHAVSEEERRYQDGGDPQVLDVIDVPLLEPSPGTYQRENWLLDPRYYWTKTATFSWESLKVLAQTSGPLWVDGDSTFHGLNDKITDEVADQLGSSLTLIHVGELRLRTFAPGKDFGDNKRRLQVKFEFDGVEYRFWVTDPIYERRYLAGPDGGHELGESYLTISLAEPHNGACYKVVAAIIEPRGGTV